MSIHVCLKEFMESTGGTWKIAEVGVWKSRTCRKLLKYYGGSIEEYWAVDQWKGTYRGLNEETWDMLYMNACRLMVPCPQLRVIRATSIEAAKLFPPAYFDLVFVDADHSFDSVIADIETWLPLVRPGGYLTGHDYISRRHPNVKKAVDLKFGDSVELICGGGIWGVHV